MRRITVNAAEIALITKRGKLVQIFPEGKYWIGFTKVVTRMPITRPIHIDDQWALFLENATLRKMVDVVEILDSEFGIEMKDGIYTRVIGAGRVLYWKSAIRYEVIKVDPRTVEVSTAIPKQILQKSGVLPYLKVYPVESYQKGLLFVDGKFVEELGPGTYYYWKSDRNPTVSTVDVRMRALNITGQEILTKDKVGVRVNFVAQYQVVDIVKALVDAKEYEVQLYNAFQLSLRAYLGTMTMDQLLANKDEIGKYVEEAVNFEAEALGVVVGSTGIKDIILPGDVKDIMNQVLIAQKKAQANTITRQEETASTRSLLNTAKLMEDNAMLMRLKEMEYMEKIAEKIGEITVHGGSQVMEQLRTMMLKA